MIRLGVLLLGPLVVLGADQVIGLPLFLLGVLLLLLGPLVILRADLDDVLLLCFKSGWSLKLYILTRV